MTMRVRLLLLLLLISLYACRVAVSHDQYAPDQTTATVIPREVAIAHLQQYFAATELGIRAWQPPGRIMPYETVLQFEAVRDDLGSYVVSVNNKECIAGVDKRVESLRDLQLIVESLVALGAKIRK